MNAPSHHSPEVRTTCPYCGVGCGMLAKADGDGGALITGDPDHPANFGRLCSKGAALGETLGLEDRLLYPMQRDASGNLVRTDWDNALDRVAGDLLRIAAQHGPDAVAFYLSGQLLTEDYYVANKLMKGFIGSANVNTNSRLCMASTVAGHRRAFGSDTVPGSYEDLDQADLMVLIGSNAAWCHPILYQRMIDNKRKRGARIVVIDPRRTATAEDADLFLPIAPGMDAALFSGLLVDLADNRALDSDYMERHTDGFEPTLAAARDLTPSLAATAALTGLDQEDVAAFFAWFAATEKVVSCYSQGVNQSAQGTDKVTSIINCHLATGRIGRPGMGPLSLTGQPNAMGGREVGGLANQLSAHMNFTPHDISRVSRFWNAPRMAQHEGLKAVEMFEAIERGEIKALWVMATNPAVSLPRAGAVAAALGKLDLFVVSDNVLANDTLHARPRIVLPATAWGEKDGTVTNSERRISRQCAFLAAPGEARPDWWIVAQVARRMGFAGFDYRNAADVFREHAALSAFENDGAHDFDIGALAAMNDAEFNSLAPVQWPVRAGEPQADSRFFAQGGFFTADRKARFHAPQKPALRATLTEEFPLWLNTGRIRDQWHTMTRSGLSARLAAHMPEPFIEVHPGDGQAFDLAEGGFAKVTSAHGSCVLRVKLSDGQQRGAVFAPIHWSGQTASSARIGELVAPSTDPFSGQPEAKATPVKIAPVEFASHGFALTRTRVMLPAAWWCRVAVKRGHGLLLADNAEPSAWRQTAQRMFGVGAVAEYADERRGVYRAACFVDGPLEGCLFVGPAQTPLHWDAMKALFEADNIADPQRRVILSGKSADGAADPGALVCACFGVGFNTIRTAITSSGAGSVESIGAALRAGTNCGSCVPELKRMLGQEVPSSRRCEMER
ncbi:MAG: molybdopterin-dependent oxidoreductase [Xanthobacteraceae bacterium]